MCTLCDLELETTVARLGKILVLSTCNIAELGQLNALPNSHQSDMVTMMPMQMSAVRIDLDGKLQKKNFQVNYIKLQTELCSNIKSCKDKTGILKYHQQDT